MLLLYVSLSRNLQELRPYSRILLGCHRVWRKEEKLINSAILSIRILYHTNNYQRDRNTSMYGSVHKYKNNLYSVSDGGRAANNLRIHYRIISCQNSN